MRPRFLIELVVFVFVVFAVVLMLRQFAVPAAAPVEREPVAILGHVSGPSTAVA